MKIFSLCLVLIYAQLASAQFDFDPSKLLKMLDSPIESDRPGFALAASTCGIASFQIQSGVNRTKWVGGIDASYTSYLIPTELRFGLTKKLEFNTSFSYLNVNTVTIAGPSKSGGFLSPEIGFRYVFMHGKKWSPNLALQSNLSFLSHRGNYYQKNFGSSFYLISSNKFNKLSINANAGIRFSGDDNFGYSLPYVLNFGYNFSEKFSVFVEGFGIIDNFSLGSDLGFAYSPISTLQFDLFGGLSNSLDPANSPWFIEAGVSWKYSFLKAMAKKKIKEFTGAFGIG